MSVLLRLLAVAVLWMFATVAHAATTAEIDQARNKGVAWLFTHQNGNGSWSSSSGLKIQPTAAALEALLNSGIKRGYGYAAGEAWLANAEASSTDSLARQIIALKKTGANVTPKLDQLLAMKNMPDRATWGAYSMFDTSFPDTPLALSAIRTGQYSYANQLNELYAALYCEVLPAQRADGGWSYIKPPSTAPGNQLSSIFLATAYNILELKAIKDTYYWWSSDTCGSVTSDLTTSITNGVAWLLTRKNADGGFGDNGQSSIQETALAYLALTATNSSDPAKDAALNYLIAHQQTDGSWGGDPFQTALALKALPAATLVDTDKDGIPDTVEALLGTNPLLADTKRLVNGNGEGMSDITISGLLAVTKINQAFSITLTPPSGGTAPYTWSVVSGSLPDGLTLNSSTGVISGTPVTNGTFNFISKVTDSTGSSATMAGQIVIDTLPPTGTIVINAGASYTSSNTITLALFISDNNGTVSQMQFSNDNVNWSTAETYATSKTWMLAGGDGVKTVYARFKDPAGNWSTAVSDTIVLDTSVPVAPVITSPGNGATVNATTVTLTGTAPASTTVKIYDGIALMGSTTASASGTWSYTARSLNGCRHNFAFTATATNGAGTASVPSAAVAVTINTTTPVISGTGAVCVAAGSLHTVALKWDGSVTAWGDNTYGQTSVPASASSGVVAVATGNNHTVALKLDGSVVAWGQNDYGQTMVPATALSGVIAVAAGVFHTVALKSDGSVVVWGGTYQGPATVPTVALSGVVAIAAIDYRTVALKSDGSVIAWHISGEVETTMPVAASSGVIAISAGSHHTVALKSDGSVIAWGDNTNGQISVPAEALSGVVAIDAGSVHTVALKADGSVVAWGSSGYGKTTVPAAALSGVVAIAAGSMHTVALKSDGSVIAWGENTYGQSAGFFTTTLISSASTVVSGLPVTFTATVFGSNPTGTVTFRDGATILGTATVSGGRATFSTAALTLGTHSISAVYGGDANNPPLTSEAIAQEIIADSIPNPFSFTAKTGAPINSWASTTFVVTGLSAPASISITGGKYWIPGSADFTSDTGLVSNNQTVVVGLTSSAYFNTTTRATLTIGGVSGTFSVTTLNTTPVLYGVQAVASGSYHTVALKSDSSVAAWGAGGPGETDFPHYGQSTVPATASSGVVAVAAGWYHSMALKSDGSVVGWGNNGSGQTTVPAAALSGVVAIAASANHTVALKSTGSVVAWGSNLYGESTVPTTAASGVVAIAAGRYHTVALKSNGSVVAWGYNGFGQATVPAAASSGVVAIAAGDYHTVALKSNGSVVAWGQSSYGQTTVPAAALSGIIAIAAGAGHTVALKSNGSVVAWGDNYYGETTVPSAALSGVVAIAAGDLNTLAIKADGSVIGWGPNGYGQSASADTIAPVAPVITTPANGTQQSSTNVDVSGIAEALSTVKIYDGATLLGNVAANSSGAWSYNASSLSDGTHSFIAIATDAANNTSSGSTPVTVVIDTREPITGASVAGGAYNALLSVALNCGDAGSGCGRIYYTTNGTLPTLSSSVYAAPININATTTLKYFAIDQTGNSETVKSQTYTMDFVSPSTAISPSGGAYNRSQSVTLTCGDGPGVGCDKIYYTMDGSNPTTSSSVYLSPISISATTTIKYFSTDLAGNSEVVKNQTYTIDTIAPLTTASPVGGSYNSTQSVILTCSDGGSGCSNIHYTVDGTTPTIESSIYSAPISIDADATLQYFSIDLAGNSEAVKREVYIVDTTAPTGTVAINSGAASTNSTSVALSLTCTDTNGCSQVQFSDDNTVWSSAEVYVTNKVWIFAAGDGTKTVYVKFRDTLGNWSMAYSAAITLDTTAPTAPMISSPASGMLQITTYVTLSGTAETFSTVKIYDGATLLGGVTVTDGTWSYTATSLSNGSHSFAVTATDAAGNTSDVSIAVAVRIDTTAAITTALPGTSAFNSALSVELTCADGGGSGCDKIYYTLNGTTPSTSAAVYSAPISVSSTTTLKYFATDLAGNSETVQSQTYTLDTTKPTGTIVINSGATTTNSTNVTLSLTCTDANGCSQMVFSNDNINWSSAEAYAVGKAWTLTGGDGTKTVYVKFKDSAGNWSVVYSDTISFKTYDLTITAVSGPTTGNITQQISVSYTVKNQGGSSVGSFNAGIYLSTDATVSMDDTFLGYDTVSSLGVGSQTTRSKSVRIPANMTAGTYYVGIIADYESVVAETDEANNARSGNQIAITTVPPDLIITAVSGPASANVTQQVTISTTVKNLGGTTGGFNVSVYLSTDAAIDASDAFLGTVSVGTLSAGAQSISNPVVRIPASVPVGTYYVLALADSGNVITETNEGNNTLAGNLIAIAADIPDLTVSAVSCPTNANITEPLTVSTTVKNLGGITNAFSVNIYLSADTVITTSDRLLGTISVTGIIPAGGEIPLTATFRLSSSTPAGTYYVGAMADSGGVITEISEANNTLAGNLITTTAQRPDLIITTVAGPTGANITELATVSTAVKNLGGTTGNFSVNIYLSTDAVISTSDKLLGTISVPGALSMNGEIPLTASLRIPTSVTAGIYTLGAVVDPSNQIAELSDTNNALAGNSMVTTATYPDLIVTTVAGPATGIKGQPIAVSSAVKNQGGTTGGFSVGIYLSTDATITTNDTRIGTYNVDSIAGGTELQGGNSFTIPATLTSGTYYIGAFADYTKVASETNEANNALAGNKITISP